MADRLLRLGRACRRGAVGRGTVRRRPLCRAGADPSRHAHLRGAAGPRCQAQRLARQASARLAPWSASIPGCTRRPWSRSWRNRWSPRASSSRRCPGTPSTASGGASARRRRRAPVVLHPTRYAGKPAEQKIAELQAALRKEGEDAVVLTLPDSIAWLLNIRGSDVAHNPVALAFAIVPASGKVELFIDPAKIERGGQGATSPSWPGSARPRRSRIGSGALKGTHKRIRLDANTAASWFFRKLKGGKARIVRGADPCLLPKARKNATEIEGRARRPQARRGRRCAFPRLARSRVAAGSSRRDRDLAPPRDAAQRDAGAQGDQLRHHLGGGTQRRHRALSRHHPDQSQAEAGRALSRRLRRPVPRRHHRHHPHGRHRHADARDARALHPGAEGPYRHRHGAISQGHARRRPRPVRAPRTVGGGARLRPRHRPWRRQLSLGARRPAEHLQTRHDPAGARHDRLQRARLLQAGCLRHPHREPGAGHRSRRRWPAASAR